MPNRERRADGSAGVARRRLNIDVAERRLFEDLAVGRAVESDSAGQAQSFLPGALVDMIQEREIVLFEDGLHGCRQIGVPCGDFLARRPRLAEDLDHFAREQVAGDRLATIPSHLDALAMVREVIQVKAGIGRFRAERSRGLAARSAARRRPPVPSFCIRRRTWESPETE